MTSWFDESPETYDRARPSYPEQLWDELFRRLPDIRVPDGAGPTRGDSALVLSIDSLPAVFTPT